MPPKKDDSSLKGVVMQVRVTEAEAAQFRAQAAARKMVMSSYLRYLLLDDADRLSEEGKLRRGEKGDWEIFSLGTWQPPFLG